MALIGNLRGSTGTPGPPGASGTPGAPGSQWFNGTAAPPPDTLGRDGDYYLNTNTADVYTKAGGTWA